MNREGWILKLVPKAKEASRRKWDTNNTQYAINVNNWSHDITEAKVETDPCKLSGLKKQAMLAHNVLENNPYVGVVKVALNESGKAVEIISEMC